MLLCMWVLPAWADASTPEQSFDVASDLLAKGKYKEGADALLKLADDAPDSAIAADALFAAAGILEDKLAQPVRAANAYRRLVDKYPDSRTALAASRRLQDLERALGPNRAGAAAVAVWSDVLARFPERPPEQSIQIVEKLIQQYPTWAGRPRALVWLATLHHRRGEWHKALARYKESADAAKEVELQFEALLGAATVLTRLERFAEAGRYLDKLPVADAPGRARARDDARAKLNRARWRARLYITSYVLLLLVLVGLVTSLRFAAGSWRGAAKALRRPPLEVVYMAPIAGVFIGVSFTAHYAIAPAVIIVCVGGAMITWLSGAGLRLVRSPSRARPLTHLAGCFVGVLALAYVALHRTRLIDMLIETVRFGPDV